jgi:hypothetical protein
MRPRRQRSPRERDTCAPRRPIARANGIRVRPGGRSLGRTGYVCAQAADRSGERDTCASGTRLRTRFAAPQTFRCPARPGAAPRKPFVAPPPIRPYNEASGLAARSAGASSHVRQTVSHVRIAKDAHCERCALRKVSPATARHISASIITANAPETQRSARPKDIGGLESPATTWHFTHRLPCIHDPGACTRAGIGTVRPAGLCSSAHRRSRRRSRARHANVTRRRRDRTSSGLPHPPTHVRDSARRIRAGMRVLSRPLERRSCMRIAVYTSARTRDEVTHRMEVALYTVQFAHSRVLA